MNIRRNPSPTLISLLLGIGLVILIYMVFSLRDRNHNQTLEKTIDHAAKQRRPRVIIDKNFSGGAKNFVNEEVARFIEIPAAQVRQEEVETKFPKKRNFASDEDVLKAGISAANSEKKVDATSSKRMQSIIAKDWDGEANLLVNQMRAGQGFEVNLETIEAFLRGKEFYGWPLDQRNWIGDEMMTMLRQEMPNEAYRMFRDIQGDKTAPAAMRDYCIQHISHLIGEGRVGFEGVGVIIGALESEDPVHSSTALISLYRLSENLPALITHDQVLDYAKRYQESTDFRLQATARAILEESK